MRLIEAIQAYPDIRYSARSLIGHVRASRIAVRA
jgi:hypothetical protein